VFSGHAHDGFKYSYIVPILKIKDTRSKAFGGFFGAIFLAADPAIGGS